MGDFDLALGGGRITGAGSPRAAAGRGLRVLLLEQNDLASGTSSASTKLIHGGLRYLEHGWFRLVRGALPAREVVLRMAPAPGRPPPTTAAGCAWGGGRPRRGRACCGGPRTWCGGFVSCCRTSRGCVRPG